MPDGMGRFFLEKVTGVFSRSSPGYTDVATITAAIPTETSGTIPS